MTHDCIPKIKLKATAKMIKIHMDIRNQRPDMETTAQKLKKHYNNLRNNRAPNYSHMKTVGYRNDHVLKISCLNLLRAITKFQNLALGVNW